MSRQTRRHLGETDKRIREAMEQSQADLSDRSKHDSMMAMMRGVSEAREEEGHQQKREQKRSFWFAMSGTVAAFGIGALLLFNTAPVQEQIGTWFGEEDAPAVDEDEEEQDDQTEDTENDEEPQDEDDNEEIEEEADFEVNKPSFEVVPPEDVELDSNNRLPYQTVEFSYEGKTWEETFTQFEVDALPLNMYIPEDWEVSEETGNGDQIEERIRIGDHIMFDYYSPGANANNVESSVDDMVQNKGIQSDEVKALSEDELPEIGRGMPYHILEGGYHILIEGDTYQEIYYGELSGRYVKMTFEFPYDEPEQWSDGDVLLQLMSQQLPSVVETDDQSIDSDTEREEEPMIQYQVDDGVAEQTFQLFYNEELQFSTYIPSTYELEETEDDQVEQYIFTTSDDREGQLSLGIFDEDVSRQEAWDYILDNFAQGRNGAQNPPSWAVDEYRYGPGTDATGRAILAERNGRFFYIEEHAENPETSMLEFGPTLNIAQEFWRWEETDEPLVNE
ncbi:hypothetical protein ABID56_001683 [Alkalibacillus flavidus]|uniref:DUF4367 domain-containing protein n=1 Tax=Alkalibacillus flavidus TaxID=546021 RepID=A0ABV2KVG9_9BACI